tara:strand:+ start:1115 stop:2047 length:933 start_codon:yes stop_codon:yes gene_type:complete
MTNRKITELTSLTAPAASDVLPIIDIDATSNALKNKKITYAELLASGVDGSQAAPTFSFESDADTGMYSSGANSLAFTTGGTGRLRIESDGTTVVTAGSANKGIELEANGARVGRFGVLNPGVEHQVYIGTLLGNSFVFRTNNTEKMRISPSGKITAQGVYDSTTTGGSAVYVESDGDLLRFTSSLKYKTDVETLEDARADAILNCRPVWYRSKCANDIKTEGAEKSDWGWYGFIAEEVAEIEPRLVSWTTKDAIPQEDGSVKSVERDPADYEAEGVRYENFVPLLLNLVKRQQAAIESLEAKVAALEAS